MDVKIIGEREQRTTDKQTKREKNGGEERQNHNKHIFKKKEKK